MKALDLYGGADAVRQRMRQLLIDRLGELTLNDIRHWVEDLGVSGLPDLVTFDPATSELSYDVFHQMMPALECSMVDILGAPDFSGTDIKAYWESQMADSPMLIVGAGDPPRISDLSTYCFLRALEELQQSETQ